MATGTKAPSTQSTWKRVSKRAKARPRLASGASRWRMESKASLPPPAAKPTDAPSKVAPMTSPMASDKTPASTMKPSTPVSRFSSDVILRMRGPAAAPPSWLKALTAPTTPNSQGARSPPRKSKATSRVRNPTQARMMPMAEPAMMIEAPRSSWRSVSSRDSVATLTAAILTARTPPNKYTIIAIPSDHSGPSRVITAAAGTMPTNPEMPLRSESLELASTSSVSVRTTLGTNALRATWYARWQTSSTRA